MQDKHTEDQEKKDIEVLRISVGGIFSEIRLSSRVSPFATGQDRSRSLKSHSQRCQPCFGHVAFYFSTK